MLPFLLSLSTAEMPIGVLPELYANYSSAISKSSFRCLDNSRTISIAQVNDGYADCDDASDEPGTSAGPKSRFFCRNLGYVPQIIARYLVGDGICDCCDGSDESFNNRVECPNECSSLEKQRQKLLNKILRPFQRGLSEKKALEKEGIRTKSKAEKKKGSIQSKIDNLTAILKQFREPPENRTDPLLPEVASAIVADNRFENLTGLSAFVYNVWQKTFRAPKIDHIKRGIDETEQKLGRKRARLEESKKVSDLDPSVDASAIPLLMREFTKGKFVLSFLGSLKEDHQSLGEFRRFEGGSMIFDGGEYCWQTKAGKRTELKILCWEDTRLIDVKEGQSCQYSGILATPIGCSPETVESLKNATTSELEAIMESIEGLI